MIRFACPGCNSTFTVADDRAGKVTRCPKCQTKFLIPDADPAAAAAPPPVPPPPPPPVAANEPVEVAPCPKCGTRLSVMPGDLGLEVECPSCQTVFKAVEPGTEPPAPPPAPPKRSSLESTDDTGKPKSKRRRDDDDDDDRPSRRRKRDDDDEDDDRPSRRGRKGDDEEEDDRPSRRGRRDEDDDERPSRRGRREEDDEDEDRPRRRRSRRPAARSGPVTTVGVLNYLLGGLCFLCSCVALLGMSAIKEAMARGPKGGMAGPGGMPQNGVDSVVTIVYILMGVYILFAILLIVAGVGVSMRKSFGRYITFGTAAIAIVLGLLSLLGAGSNLIGGNIPGACGALLGTAIWLGYGGYAISAMLKYGDEFS